MRKRYKPITPAMREFAARVTSEDKLKTNPALTFHHTATSRGYESRSGGGHCEAYSGRFGIGYIWYSPRYDTTNYCYANYYIFNDSAVEDEIPLDEYTFRYDVYSEFTDDGCAPYFNVEFDNVITVKAEDVRAAKKRLAEYVLDGATAEFVETSGNHIDVWHRRPFDNKLCLRGFIALQKVDCNGQPGKTVIQW